MGKGELGGVPEVFFLPDEETPPGGMPWALNLLSFSFFPFHFSITSSIHLNKDLSMSTKPRIFVPHVPYQIRSRIAEGLRLFPSPEYKTLFLSLLERYFKASGYICLKKTFYEDRYHLEVKASDVCVSWLMRSINSVYAKILNKYYGRSGEMFPDRFSSIIVDEEYGLDEVLKYSDDISAEESVPDNENQKIGQGKNQMRAEGVADQNNNLDEKRQIFMKMIDHAHSICLDYSDPRECIFGRPAFREDAARKHHNWQTRRKANLSRDSQHILGLFDKIMSGIFSIGEKSLMKRGRKNGLSRNRELFSLLGVFHLDFLGADLGRYLGVSRSAISRMISRRAGCPHCRTLIREILNSFDGRMVELLKNT